VTLKPGVIRVHRGTPFSGVLGAAALLGVLVLTSCAPEGQTQISSTSGPPPKVHEVLLSPDGQWELTVVERHPTDPDLHGTTWQVWLGPKGQVVDSTHCVFDAQEIRPKPLWHTADSVTIHVSGQADRLSDIPPSYHSTETVLGRDLQRHNFAVFVTQDARK
jgi:hypothetical protein